jgi:replicative DNA helicase
MTRSDEPRELLARAEAKIFEILEHRSSAEAKPIDEVLEEVMVRMDARMKHEHALGGVETGFTDLDTLCGGLHNSELIILAARPSMGKTAFAMNIAEHVAIATKQPVLFVSLEMACLELADRLLCSAAQVNGHRLRNGTISQEDRRRLVQKSAEISSSPLYIDDTPGRTLTEIAAVARRLKRRKGLSLVVIDYLQLIEPDNPRDPRQEQVARIARRLKMMSRELDIPVLCLAQLNRQAEVSRDNRPRLNHLRESGAIEQDADVVMFVHREEYYQTTDEDRERVKGQAEIIIAKQRNGPIGDIKLLWQHDFTRFVNLEHRPYDEFEQFSASSVTPPLIPAGISLACAAGLDRSPCKPDAQARESARHASPTRKRGNPLDEHNLLASFRRAALRSVPGVTSSSRPSFTLVQAAPMRWPPWRRCRCTVRPRRNEAPSCLDSDPAARATPAGACSPSRRLRSASNDSRCDRARARPSQDRVDGGLLKRRGEIGQPLPGGRGRVGG